MRPSLAVALLLLSPVSDLQAAENVSFPYEAVVEAPDAYARSGPGRKYYPTSRLKPGDRVIVHRHDPGGWYMIAPPAGSFSWIPAKYVQRSPGSDRGAVTTNNVVVRVGSFESDIRDVEQRRLSTGDEVRILGEKTLASDGEQPQLWYKIAPPAREWRWITGQSVAPVGAAGARAPRSSGSIDSQLPTPLAGHVTPANDPFAGATPANRLRQPATAYDPKAPPRSGAERLLPSDGTGTLVERPLVRLENGSRSGNNSGNSGFRGDQVAAAPGPAPAQTPKTLAGQQVELDRLDARLSAIVEKQTAEWEFADVERDYLRLREEALYQNFRKIIENRLGTIAHYKQLRAEYDDLMRLVAETTRRDAELAAQDRQREAQMVRRSVRFDGAGIVQHSATTYAGAPRHVLLAPNGRVLAYLMPQPGVDLDSWIGRSAGIIGQRSYEPKLQSDLIVVQSLQPVRLSN